MNKSSFISRYELFDIDYGCFKNLITISGMDGSGKSITASSLQKKLEDNGKSSVVISHKIEHNPLFYKMLSTLYSVHEVDSIDRNYMSFVIALEYFAFLYSEVYDLLNENIVILDRSPLDLYVNQEYLFGCDFKEGWKLFNPIMISSNHFILNVDSGTAHSRIVSRDALIKPHELLDALKVQYLGYSEIANIINGNITKIDGTESISKNVDLIVEIMKRRWS